MQSTLFDVAAEPTFGDAADAVRTDLGRGAWIDWRPNWLTGADGVFDHLMTEVDWQSGERQMYDSVVTVPRLTRTYGPQDRWPHPVLREACAELSRAYRPELPEGFATAGLCLYRHQQDSVAWHGDRIGRARNADTLVAIVSLGASRVLALRPRGGGEAIRLELAHGDLLVMGGSCQRTFDHCVPKQRTPVGPRISIQYRPIGVW
ncbi:alpha-ketoglutarate-dependent dioxygenase AlkB [Enemella sp. A6]|uniref:alpha-ketoglutarate-dependent dioxygenase AlkB n=1 Tax=Enemella sp. A6 TaxID=3440152 RepID=UPI003EBC07D0